MTIHVKFTELVGAVVLTEKPTARRFRFGNRVKWVGKQFSKVDNLQLYVKHSIAVDRQHDFNGVFIRGSDETRMRAMEEMPVAEMENAAKDIQRDLNKLWKAIQEYKKLRDSELSEEHEDNKPS